MSKIVPFPSGRAVSKSNQFIGRDDQRDPTIYFQKPPLNSHVCESAISAIWRLSSQTHLRLGKNEGIIYPTDRVDYIPVTEISVLSLSEQPFDKSSTASFWLAGDLRYFDLRPFIYDFGCYLSPNATRMTTPFECLKGAGVNYVETPIGRLFLQSKRHVGFITEGMAIPGPAANVNYIESMSIFLCAIASEDNVQQFEHKMLDRDGTSVCGVDIARLIDIFEMRAGVGVHGFISGVYRQGGNQAIAGGLIAVIEAINDIGCIYNSIDNVVYIFENGASGIREVKAG